MKNTSSGFMGEEDNGMGLSSNPMGIPPKPETDNEYKGILHGMASGVGSIIGGLVSGYKEKQKQKHLEILLAQRKSMYGLHAIEVCEAASACAAAISIIPPNVGNIQKPFNPQNPIYEYFVHDCSGGNKPYKPSIAATLCHVLDERRSKQLSLTSARIFVDVDYAPNGYNLRLKTTNMTNASLLPGFGYGKNIGKLHQDNNNNFFIMSWNTARPLPLGAHFERLDEQFLSWINEAIDYAHFNPILNAYCGFYYFRSNGQPIESCFAKV